MSDSPATPRTDQQAYAATPEDLYRGAMNHYNRLSGEAHDWLSSIPHALKWYFFEKPKLERELTAAQAEITRLNKQIIQELQRQELLEDRAEQAEAALATVRKDALEKAEAEIPSNWLDPLLSGKNSALQGFPWGCPEIEALLNGLKLRIRSLKDK